jgi:hypothetical protein
MAIRNSGLPNLLLPFAFGALLFGDLKRRVNARGGILLHPGQNMTKEV